MNKQFNNISLALGIPGWILQIVGGLNERPVVTLIGGILLIAGLAYYAKSKKGTLPGDCWGCCRFLRSLFLDYCQISRLIQQPGRAVG